MIIPHAASLMRRGKAWGMVYQEHSSTDGGIQKSERRNLFHGAQDDVDPQEDHEYPEGKA